MEIIMWSFYGYFYLGGGSVDVSVRFEMLR
uniref:Uncharacterized protein n=1 Tax=Arundo donax TaxID=35708 RepID=A0A0A8Y419_ARUDO